jgi:formylmethanofuran dehydrogenase subunit E
MIDVQNYEDVDWDDEREPRIIGSCERCNCDVSEDEAEVSNDGWLYCDQCAWYISQPGVRTQENRT